LNGVAHDDLRAAALGQAASIELMQAVMAGLALNRGRHDRAYDRTTDPRSMGEEQP
jgi:hypothetical protein